MLLERHCWPFGSFWRGDLNWLPSLLRGVVRKSTTNPRLSRCASRSIDESTPAGVSDSALPMNFASPRDGPLMTPRSLRILCVDDNVHVLSMLVASLREKGFVVEAVVDGVQALERIPRYAVAV